MGFWVGKPDLRAGESVQWAPLVNRDQGGRAVGGRLYVTEARLLFQPNRFDAVTGGKRWVCDLEDVGSVGEAPRDGSFFSGGLRTRLRLETKSGDVERFVINHLDESVDRLRMLISANGTRPAVINEQRSRSLRPWIVTGLVVSSCIALLLLNIFVLH